MKLVSPVFFALFSVIQEPSLKAAEAWIVRIEEPTGLYPRTNEIIAVPYPKIGGEHSAWLVVDQRGREQPWQNTRNALLFPVTLIPGELPEYRIQPMRKAKTNFVNQIRLRTIGMNRLELGNRFFRVLIDKQAAAFVEAFNFCADTYRTLNLVETTPEDRAALKDDIHASEAMGFKPVSGVPEGNLGWTSLGGTGPITKIHVLEDGPLRGTVRLERTNETWELKWTAESRSLVWRATKGFRFTAVSASPYLPFDRCVGGSEYQWPTGPDADEPPDHDISPRPWSKLPGDHVVYYHNEENYGALGIVALDTNLTWTGIGSRRFIAELLDTNQQSPATHIAITFPEWRGANTVLEARRQYRILRQPLLFQVEKSRTLIHEDRSADKPSKSADRLTVTLPIPKAEGRGEGETDSQPSEMLENKLTGDVSIKLSAQRTPEIDFDSRPQTPEPFEQNSISLNGDWELAWCEKGAGPPTNGWRHIIVPGSAHTQWLDGSKIYSPDATWVSYKEWWYRRQFIVPDTFAGKRLRLHFGATDYYADAWLNGTRLGRHEGYIDPYEYDVTLEALVGATNQLVVRAWTPVDYYWKHRPYTVKGAYGAVDQKPDDITPLGITRPVRLVAAEPLLIKDLGLNTRLLDDANAEVEVEVELEGEPDAGQILELTLSPRNFNSNEHHWARARATGRTLKIAMPVDNPHLWWTWDHGKPDLYTLDVRLRDETGRTLDERSLAVGIREIERIGWTWYLNRRRMFIRSLTSNV